MEIDQFNVVKVNVLPFFGQAGVICATEKTARGGCPQDRQAAEMYIPPQLGASLIFCYSAYACKFFNSDKEVFTEYEINITPLE